MSAAFLVAAVVAPVVAAGGAVVGGIIVLAFVWEKIRPVIIVKTEKGSKVFVAVSHSKKRKNLKKLTQEGLSGITVGDDSYYGLANAPSKTVAEIGSVTVEKAQELLDSIGEKKLAKIEKRANPG